jgi:hypothetical protein
LCDRLDGTHGLIEDKSRRLSPTSAGSRARSKPAAQNTAEVWNVHVSDKVANPSIQRQMVRAHGKM